MVVVVTLIFGNRLGWRHSWYGTWITVIGALVIALGIYLLVAFDWY